MSIKIPSIKFPMKILTILFIDILLFPPSLELKKFPIKLIMGDGDRVMMPANIARKDEGFLFLVYGTNFTTASELLLFVVEQNSPGHSCRVKLRINRKSNIKDFRIERFDSFGSKSAVILWTEKVLRKGFHFARHLHVNVINMTSCKSQLSDKLTDVDIDSQYSGMIVYPNQLDLVIENHPICGEMDICKVTYNEEGKQVGEPVLFSKYGDKFFALPALNYTLDRGIFVISSLGTDVDGKIIYVDERGREKLVDRNRRGARISDTLQSLSSTHNLFTFCLLEENKHELRCLQYDWVTNKATKATFTLNSWVSSVAVSNLFGGGFDLLITYCNHFSKHVCDDFVFLKIDRQGRMLKLLQMPLGITCNNEKSPRIDSGISDVEDQLCLYFACENNEERQNVHYLYNQCMSKYDT